MTARPFWDPVTGAAIAHLGLRIAPDREKVMRDTGYYRLDGR